MPYSEEKDSHVESSRQGPDCDNPRNKSTTVSKFLTLASIVLVIILAISLAFTVKSAISSYQTLHPPRNMALSLARSMILAKAVYLIISLLAGIASYIAYTILLYVCYKNATKLEPAIFQKSSFKILWTALIPGINFFYQYQYLSDLWQFVQNDTNNRLLRTKTTMQILFFLTLFAFLFTLADLFALYIFGVGPLFTLSNQFLFILAIVWSVLIFIWQALTIAIYKGLKHHVSPRTVPVSPNNTF